MEVGCRRKDVSNFEIVGLEMRTGTRRDGENAGRERAREATEHVFIPGRIKDTRIVYTLGSVEGVNVEPSERKTRQGCDLSIWPMKSDATITTSLVTYSKSQPTT
jgi:hypothetical protein